MLGQLQLLPGAITEMLVSVTETGTLTQADRYGLMAAVLDENLPEDEVRIINRILHSVLRHRIQVAC